MNETLNGFGADLLELVTHEVSLDPHAPITPDTDLLLTGLVDSLGVIEIVAWMEERLGIEIDPTDVVLENFQSVGLMLEYAARRTA